MSNKILFIFEGERTEYSQWEVFDHHYSLGNTVILCAFANNIYDLYRIVNNDDDLQIVEIIRNRSQGNKDVLEGISATEISEIYLFFDYDCHDTKSTTTNLHSLVEKFSDEYEHGRIFISYPMCESHRHCYDAQGREFLEKTIPKADIPRYKSLVNVESSFNQFRISKLGKESLNWITFMHLVKAKVISDGLRKCLDKTIILEAVEQIDILRGQKMHYEDIDNTVAILGAFPNFLYYYFGDDFLQTLNFQPANFDFTVSY